MAPKFFVKIGVFYEIGEIVFILSKITPMKNILAVFAKIPFFDVFEGPSKNELFGVFDKK